MSLRLPVKNGHGGCRHALGSIQAGLSWFVLCLVILLLGGLVSGRTLNKDVVMGEYRAKAVFLLNFVEYIEWPAETFHGPEDPVVIGIYRSNPFDGALKKLSKDLKIKGRFIEVKEVPNLSSLGTCHLLFVPKVSVDKERFILGKLEGMPLLTVGENSRFLPHGGMVNFFSEGGRLRFEVSSKRLNEARLKVSARLLRIAKQR